MTRSLLIVTALLTKLTLFAAGTAKDVANGVWMPEPDCPPPAECDES